ncbi:MAG: glycerophosphodiester phosphodiesterase family protein [Granulosicoccus sp.]
MDCTASIIHTPTHNFIENTVASIEAAFELGADIVEIDIHPTTDREFVVFHDWTLDCRTNGKGIVRKHDSTYLKSLDIGYGYTADGGDTYPFRGSFIGAMPTLYDVLSNFPDEKFLINIKGGNVEEAKLLTDYLLDNKHLNRERISVYGSGENIPEYAALNPDIVTLHKNTAATCLKKYLLLGWSGYVPLECHRSFIPVPRNYQWLIWGWPNRFEKRLREVGSKPLLMGDHKKGSANSGIDDVESIPEKYGGIVFTNRIDIVGPNAADSSPQ